MNILGTSGNDTLVGSNVADTLDGAAGNDSLVALFGDDWLVGGAGNDTLNGGAHGAVGDTADYRTATTNVQVDLQSAWAFDGLGGTDTLFRIENIAAGAGNDTLDGDSFPNWFYPGAGEDRVNGRGDLDGVNYDTAGAGLVVDLVQGRATGGGVGTDFLLSIESAAGSANGDVLILSHTQGGTALGKAGDDRLTGGSSADYLRGGSGDDTIDGANGDDTVLYDTHPDNGGPAVSGNGVVIDLAAGFAIDNWGDVDSLINVERAVGSDFDDLLIGNSASNHLTGGTGDDTFVGGAGDDVMLGGAGIDRVIFRGALGQYELGALPSGVMTSGNVLGEGLDVLGAIERLVFTDVSLAVDMTGNAGFVARVFAAVFGEEMLVHRGGVGKALDIVDSGNYTEEEMMQMALDAQLGPGASNAAVVDLLYTNVVGHPPSAQVRAHYVEILESGEMTQAELGLMAADIIGIPDIAANGLIYFE